MIMGTYNMPLCTLSMHKRTHAHKHTHTHTQPLERLISLIFRSILCNCQDQFGASSKLCWSHLQPLRMWASVPQCIPSFANFPVLKQVSWRWECRCLQSMLHRVGRYYPLDWPLLLARQNQHNTRTPKKFINPAQSKICICSVQVGCQSKKIPLAPTNQNTSNTFFLFVPSCQSFI